MPDKKTYLLIDSKETLNYMLHNGYLEMPDITVVSLSKEATIACEKMRITYTIIDSYCTVTEIVAFTLDNYERLLTFCKYFDSLVMEKVPDLKSRGITPFQFSYYYLKILIDSVSVKVYQLYRFLTKAGCARVVYREGHIDNSIPDSLFFPETYNLFSFAISEIKKNYSFDATFVALNIPLNDTTISQKGLAYLHIILRYTHNMLKSMLGLLRLKLLHASAFYIIFDGGPDIRYIVPLLLQRKLYPERLISGKSPLTPSHPMELCSNVWDSLVQQHEFKDFFSVEGISYLPIILSRLQFLIVNLLSEAVTAYDATALKLASNKHRRFFVLTPYVTVGLVKRSMMKACQNYNLPLITYQEGAGFGSVEHPINDYAEVRDGDILLCYGKGNQEYYQAKGFPTKQFVPVGSAHLDFISSAQTSSDGNRPIRTLMYVGTDAKNNTQHYPYNVHTSTWYFEIQKKILDCLSNLSSDFRIIIKLHPSDNLTATYLSSSEKFRHFEIRHEKLEQMLNNVDLFILDFPSTTLLICCQTSSHIFVLASPGITKLTAQQRSCLEKRAYVFTGPDELSSAIKEFVTLENPPVRNDDSYSLRYGTYKGDGNSAERVVDFLTGIKC